MYINEEIIPIKYCRLFRNKSSLKDFPCGVFKFDNTSSVYGNTDDDAINVRRGRRCNIWILGSVVCLRNN